MESVIELDNSDSKLANIELASKSFMEEVFNIMDNPDAPDDQ